MWPQLNWDIYRCSKITVKSLYIRIVPNSKIKVLTPRQIFRRKILCTEGGKLLDPNIYKPSNLQHKCQPSKPLGGQEKEKRLEY